MIFFYSFHSTQEGVLLFRYVRDKGRWSLFSRNPVVPLMCQTCLTNNKFIYIITHKSANSFHKILNNKPCSPLVNNLVPKPLPNNPVHPSASTIFFAAVR